MKEKKHFTVLFNTKPYLKKYLQSLYGNPIVFTTDNYFGMVVASMLQRPVEFHHRKEKLRMRVDKFDDELQLHCPVSFLTKYRFGSAITDNQVISLNKLFESRFEEDLYHFCTLMKLLDYETKDALEDFCRKYNIEIDVDITFDALKKKEYRTRKEFEKNTPQVSRGILQLNPPQVSRKNPFTTDTLPLAGII